jgi:hypothetical protein
VYSKALVKAELNTQYIPTFTLTQQMYQQQNLIIKEGIYNRLCLQTSTEAGDDQMNSDDQINGDGQINVFPRTYRYDMYTLQNLSKRIGNETRL